VPTEHIMCTLAPRVHTRSETTYTVARMITCVSDMKGGNALHTALHK
jgi:hypothetical protein